MKAHGDIRLHLRNGGHLAMLNAGQSAIPDQLDGVNALFIDREGTRLSIDDAAEMVRKAATLGLVSIVRVDGLSHEELATCAELAPDCVVLPQIMTQQQLRSAMSTFASGRTAIIAQIETTEAVSNLTGLMAVDGIAAFLIGPNDLATAMGYPGQPDHPDVASAVGHVAKHLSDAGHPFGLPTPSGPDRDHWSARGAQLFYIPLAAFLKMEAYS